MKRVGIVTTCFVVACIGLSFLRVALLKAKRVPPTLMTTNSTGSKLTPSESVYAVNSRNFAAQAGLVMVPPIDVYEMTNRLGYRVQVNSANGYVAEFYNGDLVKFTDTAHNHDTRTRPERVQEWAAATNRWADNAVVWVTVHLLDRVAPSQVDQITSSKVESPPIHIRQADGSRVPVNPFSTVLLYDVNRRLKVEATWLMQSGTNPPLLTSWFRVN